MPLFAPLSEQERRQLASTGAAAVPAQLSALLQRHHTRVIDLFRVLDKDSDGEVTKAELAIALASLGVSVSSAELNSLFQELDPDRSGGIVLRELQSAMTRAAPQPQHLSPLSMLRSKVELPSSSSRYARAPLSWGEQHGAPRAPAAVHTPASTPIASTPRAWQTTDEQWRGDSRRRVQRTDAEYTALLERAGLQPRTVRTGGGFKDQPFSADELLEHAAKLGDELRRRLASEEAERASRVASEEALRRQAAKLKAGEAAEAQLASLGEARAAELAQLGQERAAMRETLRQRDSSLEQLDSKLAQAEARLAQQRAQAEVESTEREARLHAQLAQLQQARSPHLRASPHISAHLLAAPRISAHLPTSPRISAHLFASPRISAHLRTSPHISAHLRASPLIEQASSEAERRREQREITSDCL